jgi:hypothetical protein
MVELVHLRLLLLLHHPPAAGTDSFSTGIELLAKDILFILKMLLCLTSFQGMTYFSNLSHFCIPRIPCSSG